MLWRTHFALGAGLGALCGMALHPNDPLTAAAFAGMSGAASLLPDIDSPHSKLGRAVRPLSDILNFALGHRGFLHSLLGAAIVLALAAFVALFWASSGMVWSLLMPALAAGYLSHLLLDALTPGGVPLLWPRVGRASLPLVRTGSFFERAVFLPALAVAVALVVWGVAK
ncbi:MAG: metal-dependent hydrolase [Desulforudis sp.]|nr:MAG: metal-dependent hydrolase [Desulforudis sp.]